MKVSDWTFRALGSAVCVHDVCRVISDCVQSGLLTSGGINFCKFSRLCSLHNPISFTSPLNLASAQGVTVRPLGLVGDSTVVVSDHSVTLLQCCSSRASLPLCKSPVAQGIFAFRTSRRCCS